MIVDIEDDIMDPVMQCTTLPSHSGFSQKKLVSFVTEIHTSYALSWKPCQGDSLNLPDHRAQVDQGSQIKMIQVKEMMQDNDLKNSKSKDKGSKSRSQSMDEQSHYKQDKTITRQSINVKCHIFDVIGGTEEFEERDLNIGGDFIQVKQKQLNLGVETERMIFNIDSAMKHSYSNDDTYFSIDVINEILEEDFDALLDEGSKILYSIEGTLLEEEIFAEFDEFMAMTADENSDSEPPTDLELKPLPDNLEYVFLEEPSFLSVIISSQLTKEKKKKLVSILKKHKKAFAWKTTDIPGICPSFCKHKIQNLDDKKPVVQKQRRLNPNMQEVVKKEIVKEYLFREVGL
ncbi:hypothetical protein Tco_0032297 [Tanacetum coccineum]